MSFPATGVGGKVQLTSTTIANLQKWSVSAKGKMANTTAFGASGAWETNTPTVRGWTATADGWPDNGDASQVTLFGDLNAVVTVVFNIDGTHNWTGSAILSGIDPAADAQNMTTVKFAFTGTGSLTYS